MAEPGIETGALSPEATGFPHAHLLVLPPRLARPGVGLAWQHGTFNQPRQCAVQLGPGWESPGEGGVPTLCPLRTHAPHLRCFFSSSWLRPCCPSRCSLVSCSSAVRR